MRPRRDYSLEEWIHFSSGTSIEQDIILTTPTCTFLPRPQGHCAKRHPGSRDTLLTFWNKQWETQHNKYVATLITLLSLLILLVVFANACIEISLLRLLHICLFWHSEFYCTVLPGFSWSLFTGIRIWDSVQQNHPFGLIETPAWLYPWAAWLQLSEINCAQIAAITRNVYRVLVPSQSFAPFLAQMLRFTRIRARSRVNFFPGRYSSSKLSSMQTMLCIA